MVNRNRSKCQDGQLFALQISLFIEGRKINSSDAFFHGWFDDICKLSRAYLLTCHALPSHKSMMYNSSERKKKKNSKNGFNGKEKRQTSKREKKILFLFYFILFFFFHREKFLAKDQRKKKRKNKKIKRDDLDGGRWSNKNSESTDRQKKMIF